MIDGCTRLGALWNVVIPLTAPGVFTAAILSFAVFRLFQALRLARRPLTALALKQGGYDWGFLAYAVGFGGSMIWFGSSAGVALANMYPEAKSVGKWLRHGWHVALAYVAEIGRAHV